MENCMMTSPQLIADSYERYHFSVYLYTVSYTHLTLPTNSLV